MGVTRLPKGGTGLESFFTGYGSATPSVSKLQLTICLFQFRTS